jgi:hypothetical protein
LSNNRECGSRIECRQQRHVHEVQGSVDVAGQKKDAHTHRFATVSGEALPFGCGDHFHEVKFRTSFDDEHFHCFYGDSSGAIPVGNGHVHKVESVTSKNDGHKHRFNATTLE